MHTINITIISLILRYVQLSKYAITAACEVSTNRHCGITSIDASIGALFKSGWFMQRNDYILLQF